MFNCRRYLAELYLFLVFTVGGVEENIFAEIDDTLSMQALCYIYNAIVASQGGT